MSANLFNDPLFMAYIDADTEARNIEERIREESFEYRMAARRRDEAWKAYQSAQKGTNEHKPNS